MKTLFSAIAILLSSISLYATTPTITEIKQLPLKDVIKQAEDLFQQGDLEEAYPYYQALYEMRKKTAINDLYKLGKTALAAKKYNRASEYLVPLLPKAKKFPLIHYEYALTLKYQGEYVLSSQHFQSYINSHQQDNSNDYVQLANMHLQSCQKILKEQSNTSAWFLDESNDEVNDSSLVYRAPTPISKHKVGFIECQTSKGTCLKKVYSDGSIHDLNGAAGNPTFNTCSPHITADGETIFFAQQEMGQANYSIFTGKITPQGEIDHIRKLSSGINRAGYSSTHPTTGLTEQGQLILYFASTLPGSQGGYDIWYSIQTTDGNFTMAYNLGTRINGAGDDITPFYYQTDGELYFSSEKPQGYGGLDVYKMTGEKKRWLERHAHQLENPVNSKGNDFHYKKRGQGKGSFSTDRKGKEKTVKFKKIIGA